MPGVSIPIIDQLVHPSLGKLNRLPVLGNPFFGPFIALAPPQGVLALTYGVALRINSVSQFHGHDVSYPQEYDPPLGKMSALYRDGSGDTIIQQVQRWTYDDQWYVWDEALPELWNIYLYPGVSVNLFWLQT